MRIKDISIENRPRERLKKLGPKALSDAELLAIILRTGHQEENVIDMSNRLITKYGLDKLSECSLKELQEIKGIGFAKACEIFALFEFNKRHNLSKQSIKRISSAEDVFKLFHEKLKDEKQEKFIVLTMNSKNWIISEDVVFIGTLDSTLIHPREIFKSAIKNSASKIILIHNHPSGDCKPSSQDLKVTDELVSAGRLLGISVLDHVIVGNKKWWSWQEDSD